jgi:hypothetical protein
MLFLSGFAVASNDDVLDDLNEYGNEYGSDSFPEEEEVSGEESGDDFGWRFLVDDPICYFEKSPRSFELAYVNERISLEIGKKEDAAGCRAHCILFLECDAFRSIAQKVSDVIDNIRKLSSFKDYVNENQPDSIYNAARELISTTRNDCSAVKELFEKVGNSNNMSPKARAAFDAAFNAFTITSSSVDSLYASFSDSRQPEIDSNVRNLIKDFVCVGLKGVYDHVREDDPELSRLMLNLFGSNKRLLDGLWESSMPHPDCPIFRTFILHKCIRYACDPVIRALNGLIEKLNEAGASEETMTIFQYCLDTITEVNRILIERIREGGRLFYDF